MRVILLIVLFLICSFGCQKNIQTDEKLFELTMQRRHKAGPCNQYYLKIGSDGKVMAERHCTEYVECENYESNAISVEKRRCPKSDLEKVEKQLSSEEIENLRIETENSKFFSFKDNYNVDSKNCSQTSTDSPNVVLMIKMNGKEKTIKYEYGCWVNEMFGNENALQPLIELENKINQTVGIENWTKGQR